MFLPSSRSRAAVNLTLFGRALSVRPTPPVLGTRRCALTCPGTPAESYTPSRCPSRTISAVSGKDTASATGYELFEGGRRLERFETELGEGVEFESVLRRVDPPEDGDGVYAFVDTFLRAQDAFVPGWSVYLGGWCHKPGQQVQLDFDPVEADGRRVVERLDFLGA